MLLVTVRMPKRKSVVKQWQFLWPLDHRIGEEFDFDLTEKDIREKKSQSATFAYCTD